MICKRSRQQAARRTKHQAVSKTRELQHPTHQPAAHTATAEPPQDASGAAAVELQGINLGDARLNARNKKIMQALATNPEASINAVCNGANETYGAYGAYRFFDNSAVTPAAIRQPHQVATLERMRAQPVVLIAQDTTDFNFTAHPARDAQVLSEETQFGLFGHYQLAVTPDMLALGVVDCQYFAHDPESLGKALERRSWPIEEKESVRWLEGYRQACQLAEQYPGTQIVSVADREAAELFGVL